jgi:copper chaperone CopZ
VAVRHALREVDGVVAADVSYDDRRADVQYRPSLVTPESLVAAIDRIGFQASVLEPAVAASYEVR